VTISQETKPRLPSHYYVLYEPPDTSGDEALIFVSERRKIKVKGTLFREFHKTVLPLLDGQHTVAEIEATTADLFPPGEVTSALKLLAEHNLLTQQAGENGGRSDQLQPQLNFFHELERQPQAVQERLTKATVSVLGLGGAGSLVAAGLAAAGVGRLRLLDSSVVLETDGYFDPVFVHCDRSQSRASVVQRAIKDRWPSVGIEVDERILENEAGIKAAVDGSDLVVCCTDRGEASALYKLNRTSMQTLIPWISCTVSGFEVLIGPLIRPHDTPCYVCYAMRSVACADEPEDEFAFHRFLDHRKRDDSSRRENLVFAAGLAANLLGLEALKFVTGIVPCATAGCILVVSVMEMTMKKHIVLRHPHCPVCYGNSISEPASAAELTKARAST
jgi:molybdopterin-synthase adenylyltransferase